MSRLLSALRGGLVGVILLAIGKALLVMWITYTVTFSILYVLPSDPVAIMLNQIEDQESLDEAAVAAIRAEYGLDKPVVVQYLTGLLGALRLDLGASFQTGRPVAEMIGEVFPHTLQLTLLAFALTIALGFAVALLAHLIRNRAVAQIIRALPPIGASMPSFWVGLLLMQLIAFNLGLLPPTGNRTFAALILPALTLAIPGAAVFAQIFSRSIELALAEPYVVTARAFGFTRAEVLVTQVLRNALLPAVTILGLTFGELLAGTVVTETVFGRAGLGRLAQTAVTLQDIPLVQGIALISALIFVSANLVVDLVYPLLDPRVRTRKAQVRRAA